MLAKKLEAYRNSSAVVIGIPPGGVCVASAVAKHLSLPLEVMPAQRIKHPVDKNKSLGSVGLTEVYIFDDADNVPHDFIAHQIAILKNANSAENNFYYANNPNLSLKDKIVIITDDLLKSSEVMMACVREAKKYQPSKKASPDNYNSCV